MRNYIKNTFTFLKRADLIIKINFLKTVSLNNVSQILKNSLIEFYDIVFEVECIKRIEGQNIYYFYDYQEFYY